MTESVQQSLPIDPPRRRKWLFRISAIGIGIATLFILELVLRIIGWPEAESVPDPVVGFSSIRPLFVLNEESQRFEIPESRQTFFRPESFPVSKADGEFRIFVFGGSTVQGRPFAIETSFTTWLELSLNLADPGRPWDVVNCGGVSYASYRLVPVMEEATTYEPDLFIIYTGHNEFLEDRTYANIKSVPVLLRNSYSRVLNLQITAAMHRVLQGTRLIGRDPSTVSESEGRYVLSTEVSAQLDYRGGMEFYHHDPEWHSAVISHFELNLVRMIQVASARNIPVLLVAPSYNLRDNAPFKSEHRPGLTEVEKESFSASWDKARSLYSTQPLESLKHLRAALAIDDQFAALHFEIAKLCESRGLIEQSRVHFVRAKELDICPLRILDPMIASIRRVAEKTGTRLVDVESLFQELSPGALPGNNILVDHVHPSFRGHQAIAQLIFDAMESEGFVTPRPGWSDGKSELFADHMNSLDELYFARGEERLRGLLNWARGRAKRIPEQDAGSSMRDSSHQKPQPPE